MQLIEISQMKQQEQQYSITTVLHARPDGRYLETS